MPIDITHLALWSTFHLHFGEMVWKSVLLGKNGVPAGRGLKTPIKPIGFLGVLRYKSLISGDFHVESWFSWNSRGNDELSCFMWKSRKKLESHARVDFTGGCKSNVFHRVLGAVSPPWGGILPNYPIFMEMGGISPHFMKMRWFYTIFSSVGGKWCPGGPGAETSTKPMLFLCLFRGSGHPKVGFGVDFHQKAVPRAF